MTLKEGRKKKNIRVVSVQEMKKLEEKGEKLGISKIMMMENAGAAIARGIRKRFRESSMILIVAGTGNNGGDAFVAARHLVYWGYQVSIVLLGDEAKIHAGEALTNWNIVKKIPKIRRIVISDVDGLEKLERELSTAKVIIAAIFGTGFKGEPRPLQKDAISLINKAKRPFKLSVDIPSGMEADTGEFRYAIDSDVTVAMYAAKRGVVLKGRARQKCGELVVENIGLPF